MGVPLGGRGGSGGDLEGHTHEVHNESSLVGKILGTRSFALSHASVQTALQEHPICVDTEQGAATQLIHLSVSCRERVLHTGRQQPGARPELGVGWCQRGWMGQKGHGDHCE